MGWEKEEEVVGSAEVEVVVVVSVVVSAVVGSSEVEVAVSVEVEAVVHPLLSDITKRFHIGQGPGLFD